MQATHPPIWRSSEVRRPYGRHLAGALWLAVALCLSIPSVAAEAPAGAKPEAAASAPADPNVFQRLYYRIKKLFGRMTGQTAGRVQLHVYGGEGKDRISLDPSPELRLSAVSVGEDEVRGYRLETGKDNELPPGRYLVNVTHPRFPPQAVELEVQAGVTAQLEVTLRAPSPPPTAPLVAPPAPASAPAVAPPTAAPPAPPHANGWLRIDVWNAALGTLLDDAATVTATADPDRGGHTYSLQAGRAAGLPAGRYVIGAGAASCSPQQMVVDVEPGRARIFDLRLNCSAPAAPPLSLPPNVEPGPTAPPPGT